MWMDDASLHNTSHQRSSADSDTPNLCPPIFSHVEHYSVDLFWSFLSDSFFIAGGFAYIALTVWDYYLSTPRVVGENVSSVWTTSDSYLYMAVDVMAPSVYLFNSMVDIYWTTRVQQLLKQRHGERKNRTVSNVHTPPSDPPIAPHYDDMTLRGISFSSVSAIVEPRWSVQWWRKVGAHAAHRRTVLAAVTFGLAASLAVVAALWRHSLLAPHSVRHDEVLDAGSDHMYIVSALISITGSRGSSHSSIHSRSTDEAEPTTAAQTLGASSLPWYNDNERLEDWGDVLFLLGCIMDASITDFRLKSLLILPILSSFLWLLDGCLYMRSDFVRSTRLRQWRRSILYETERHHGPHAGVLV